MARLYQNDKNQTIIEFDDREDCFFCRGNEANTFNTSVRQFFDVKQQYSCQSCQEETQPIPLNF